MSDARWEDVLASVDSAERHLGEALALFEEGGLQGEERDAYRRQMALMHTMTSGYTSVEAALLRVLSILGEDKPTGEDWHAQLLARMARHSSGSRPALLSNGLLRSARKLKSFRHWSLHSYDDDFDPDEARIAIDAARKVLAQLRPAFEAFIRQIDPDQRAG